MGFLKNFAAKFIGKKIAKELDLKEGPVENKKWYASKGVWTGIVTILVAGYESARATLAPAMGWQLPEIPPITFTLLGAMGVYSRAVAKSKIE